MPNLRGEQFSGHVALSGAANKSKKSVDEVLTGEGGAPWGHSSRSQGVPKDETLK